MRYAKRNLSNQSALALDHGGRFLEAAFRSSLLLGALLLQGVAAILIAVDRFIALDRKRSDEALDLRRGKRRSECEVVPAQPAARPQPAGLPAAGLPIAAQAARDCGLALHAQRFAPQSQDVEPQAETAMAEGGGVQVLDRVTRLMTSMRLPKERIRVFVMSEEAQQSIGSSAEALGLPDDIVQSLDSWVRELSGRWKVVPGSAVREPRKVLEMTLHYVEKYRPEPFFEVVLIEDRNLPPEAYRLFALLSKRVTLFAGNGQSMRDCA